MVRLTALFTFAALALACWFVAVALYRSTVAGPDPAAAPHDRRVAVVVVAGVAMISLVPFPWGYLFTLAAWACAAAALGLPAGRAAVLFAYLAAGSFVQRLVVLGALQVL